MTGAAGEMRSGFVTLVGRPNAGKSTLLNCLVGAKISIVSDKPQTTRLRVMGVLHRPGAQIVFIDTPGLHRPVTALGERLNSTAAGALEDLAAADAACLVLDATAPLGRGDRRVFDLLPQGPARAVVVTKCDIATRAQVLEQLAAASTLDAQAWFPVSGRTGEGTETLLEFLLGRLREGPSYFPPDMTTDLPGPWQVAEAVREQLLARLRDELPYSVATRITQWRPDRIRCDIAVERASQKGIVIGRGGQMLKQVGIAVRRQLGLDGVHLELRVRVEPDWQHRHDLVDRMLIGAAADLDDDLDDDLDNADVAVEDVGGAEDADVAVEDVGGADAAAEDADVAVEDVGGADAAAPQGACC